MKFYYLIICILFIVMSGHAQPTANGSDNYDEPNSYDYIHAVTLPLEKAARNLSDAQWDRLADDEAFNYMPQEKPKAQPRHYNDGWWYRFIIGIFEFFASVGGKILLWGLVAVIILFIIFRIIRLNGNVLFSKKDKPVAAATDENADDYIPDDWEHSIQNALNAGNLRLAVRHSYRYLLSLLSERSLIRYQSAKTNYQYANELAGTPYFQPFVQMTRQYEYAWYGGFEVQPQQFEHYYQQLKMIREKLVY